ncbi:MAG TPA: fimbrial protein [Dyella sp.]|nr:fimbrial protein [Dyella sp.]
MFKLAPRCIPFLACMLLATVSTSWSPRAEAFPRNNPTCTSSGSATLTFPSSVSIPTNAAVGATLASGNATITFTCQNIPASTAGAFIQAGQYLATLDPTNNTNGPGITFATGVAGLAVVVNGSPVATSSNACLLCGPTSTAGYQPGSVASGTGTVTANYTATLIKTGPIAVGNIASINLIPFWWYIPGDGTYGTSISLNTNLILPAITVTTPSCTIATGYVSQSVILPGVPITSMTTAGQVNGRTAFNIGISGCPSTVSAVTVYFYGANIDANTGNLVNNGTAQNVEVQLLNGTGGSATPFSAINLSGAQATAQNSSAYNVSGGVAMLNYYAQYIATGATTAGTVSTSVTFVIAYP